MPDRIIPPLTRTASDAERFARVVHGGQVDKAGRPYVEHLERVVERSWNLTFWYANSDEILDRIAQTAWLHSVLAPDRRPHGPVTPDDLYAEGYSNIVVTGLILLSGEPYRGETREFASTLDRVKFLISINVPVLNIVMYASLQSQAISARSANIPETERERILLEVVAPLNLLHKFLNADAKP